MLISPAMEKIQKTILKEEIIKYDYLKCKIADMKKDVYEQWCCSYDEVVAIDNAKSVNELFMTNKAGLAFIRNIKNKICSYSLMKAVRNPECLNIQDKEIRAMVAYSILRNRENVNDSRFSGKVVYYERLAKLSRGNFHKFDDQLILFYDYDVNRSKFELIKPKLQKLGIDLSQYDFPKYPKPSHLKHYHDAVAREVERYHDIANEEKAREINQKIIDFTGTEEYTQFLSVKNNHKYSIVPVKSGDCLAKEGAYLHHCVGTYKDRMANKESYIYFLPKTSKKDTPFFTLEVKRLDGKYVLNQYDTFYDKTTKDLSCKQFIEYWSNEHNIKIACAV